MKKVLLVIAVLALAAVIFGAGFVFAQFQPVSAQALPSYFGTSMMGHGGGMIHGGRGGYGPMHDYVEQALAEKLGLTEAQVEEQLAAGKTMYQIALDAGTAEADVPALLEAVHKTAFDKAVAAGVLTQAQADAMFQQMQAAGFGANCLNGGLRPLDGTGFQRGHRGGMMGGGRWNQQQPSQPNP
ncbi:MAG: hypothetical protein Fur0016_06630 [Anaerolineales bacterium]